MPLSVSALDPRAGHAHRWYRTNQTKSQGYSILQHLSYCSRCETAGRADLPESDTSTGAATDPVVVDGMEAAEAANNKIQSLYSKDNKVGEGTYAVVYAGRELKTGRPVAIKKIKVGQFKDGLDMSAVREVKFLRELKHPNVIELLDVFSNKSNLNLVLEFLEADLEAVIKDRSLVFQAADIKSWMLMTFKGLEFCHRNWILHRDMKPNNLLIASNGVLKIADFGLAREYADPSSTARMTSQVVTRWYRAPELLFGARSYSTAVDNWAAGCIFAELMLRVPYMAAESDVEQLNVIFSALGTPTEKDWPVSACLIASCSRSNCSLMAPILRLVSAQGHKSLPDYISLEPHKPRQDLRLLFSAASNEAIDLLTRLLLYDPRKRISTKNALLHTYFSKHPFPTPPGKLPKPSKVEKKKVVEEAMEAIGEGDAEGVRKKKNGKRHGERFDGLDAARKKVARKLEF
ncbi:BZ3500_MvSof-1268-A1-R1_Chr2-2g04945 [Microbotryum saponariae]|uniref:[RNA-polymerase]-subunit kinase n=1 Tax=Microbotryum saponariae TaxID=289078 RepID=A0A2X0K509_9BASI|nr:BZ3500_MvSof-1268-A1-R1_Chr2-2g04945 [Microbotryum saponariae]SDA00535.1 BZ3501_MvSof-1269-A2-R1_Chr2-2g04619 [Microbotryum saponariae]